MTAAESSPNDRSQAAKARSNRDHRDHWLRTGGTTHHSGGGDHRERVALERIRHQDRIRSDVRLEKRIFPRCRIHAVDNHRSRTAQGSVGAGARHLRLRIHRVRPVVPSQAGIDRPAHGCGGQWETGAEVGAERLIAPAKVGSRVGANVTHQCLNARTARSPSPPKIIQFGIAPSPETFTPPGTLEIIADPTGTSWPAVLRVYASGPGICGVRLLMMFAAPVVPAVMMFANELQSKPVDPSVVSWPM